MHDSMKRLHEVSGVNRKNAIAKQLDVSPSTVTNWSTRGVSKEGAIAAADIYNTDANYIPACITLLEATFRYGKIFDDLQTWEMIKGDAPITVHNQSGFRTFTQTHKAEIVQFLKEAAE